MRMLIILKLSLINPTLLLLTCLIINVLASATGALATSERIAMMGSTVESERVRSYFIELRQFLTDNQHVVFQAMEEKENLRKARKKEVVYFFVIDDRHPDIFKYGRSFDIITRLSNYNVGKINETELKYLAIVKNSKLIERCIKLNTKKYQVEEHKEILKITPDALKKVIDECYCKYVSKEENDKLYEELSVLYGLYSYVKNKVNIKPYVIIDK